MPRIGERVAQGASAKFLGPRFVLHAVEGAGEDRVRFIRGDQALHGGFVGARFGGGEKRRADPGSAGDGEHGGESAARRDASCRDDGRILRPLEDQL